MNETNFPDANFRNYIETKLNSKNSDKLPYANGKVKVTESVEIDCRGLGINSLRGIELFKSPSVIQCANNHLLSLTLNSSITWIITNLDDGTDVGENRRNYRIVTSETVNLKSIDKYLDPDKVEDLVGATWVDKANGVIQFNEGAIEATYKYYCLSGEQTDPNEREKYLMGVRLVRHIPATSEFFPDANFLNYIKTKLNTDNSGKNPYDETTGIVEPEKVGNIDCQNMGIKSLKGIELFPKLGQLYCQNNHLIALELNPGADIWNSDLSGQIYELGKTESETGTVDLATIDSDFDPAKVTDLEGATLSGTTLTFKDHSFEASYSYHTVPTDPDPSRLMKVEIVRYAEGIVINETDFPDAGFRKFLTEDDSMKKYRKVSADGKTVTISLGVNKMEIGHQFDGISDLTGIEKFIHLQTLNINDRKVGLSMQKRIPTKEGEPEDPNNQFRKSVKLPTSLIYLYCQNVENLTEIVNLNELTNLEILNLADNASLTTLDVTNNIKLKKLSCGSTGEYGRSTALASLTLPSDPSALEEIDCSRTHLTALDLTKCTGLKSVKVNYAKQLTSLTLPDNEAVAGYTNEVHTIICDNSNIKSLDLLKCAKLRRLECSNNSLTAIDLSKCQMLDTLSCGNPLVMAGENYNNYGRQPLDLSGNPNLTWLNCQQANIGTLDLSSHSKLVYINCGLNRVKADKDEKETEPLTLTLPSDAPNLVSLNCGSNNLTTQLDNIGIYPNLEILECADNNLDKSSKGLDISQNTKLWYVYARTCGLKKFDVSKNTKLRHLTCSYNDIESLDVSNNPELTSLNCNNNKLYVLDLSNNLELDTLHVENNHLIALDLTKQKGLFDVLLIGQTLDLGTGRHFNMNRRDSHYSGSNIQDADKVMLSSDFTESTIDTSVDDENFKTEGTEPSPQAETGDGTEHDNSALTDWLTFDLMQKKATYNYRTGGVYNADLATDPDKSEPTEPTEPTESTAAKAKRPWKTQAVPSTYDGEVDGKAVKYALMDVTVTRTNLSREELILTGVTPVEADATVSIRAGRGAAIIDGAEGPIAVYTTAGLLAATATATDGLTTRIPLPAGLYMVVTTTTTAKILVR